MGDRAASSRTRAAAGTGAGVVAVAFVALNLRGPLVALPAVSGSVQHGLGVSAGAIGLLTSIPVLCFGLASPLASLVIARAGLQRAVLLGLVGVLAGTVVRSSGGYPAAVAGTVLIGIAITIGNIGMPVVIGERFPAVVGLVTAAYTSALNVGSTLTSALTPPLAGALGWRLALVAWSALAVAGGLVWVRAARRSGPPARKLEPADADQGRSGRRFLPGGPQRPAIWRRPSTWGLTVAFVGQAFAYYGATAWLPTVLSDEQGIRASVAGASASLFQVTAIAGAFAVPALLRVTNRPRLVLLLVCALWTTLPLGLLTDPQAWWLWCAFAGAAQGGGLTVLFVGIVSRATGEDEQRQLSAIVQGFGYSLAALGPTVVGGVHDASRGWTWPLVVVAAAIVLMAASGSVVMPGRTRRASRTVTP